MATEQAHFHGTPAAGDVFLPDAARHESSAFSAKERAALEWVEEITLISEGHAHKEAFDALKPHFSEEEIVWLTLASSLINMWNRISIASRAQFAAHHASEKVAEPA